MNNYRIKLVPKFRYGVLQLNIGHFYLTLHLLLSQIDILPTPTNSLTIGYIWRVNKYCIVLYCIVLVVDGR